MTPLKFPLTHLLPPLVFFAVVFLFTACEAPRSSSSDQARNESSEGPRSGEVIYAEYCASCHGSNAETFVQREWQYGNAWMQVFASIRDGFPEQGMDAYHEIITWAEMTEITNYVMVAQENAAYDWHRAHSAPNQTHWESEVLEFELETVVDALDTPWGMAFLPQGGMLITQRPGRLEHVHADGSRSDILGIPQVVYRSQAGLFDVALHPDYRNNGWIYLSYAKPSETDKALSTTAVVRGRIQSNRWVDQQTIFIAEPYVGTNHHYGGRIKFDSEGALLITVGERGQRDRFPQDLSADGGKIHRVLDNGRPHPTNPFYGESEKRQTIFSYGHRNPQGLFVHPQTGAIWSHEHGPRGGDELNRIQSGANYGWKQITYGVNYNGNLITNNLDWNGMEQPNYFWVPSIAPCGMEVVTSTKYPGWQGNFLVGSLAYEYLERLVMDGDSVVHREKLLPGIGRIREVEQGPDGYLYLAIEGRNEIVRLAPL